MSDCSELKILMGAERGKIQKNQIFLLKYENVSLTRLIAIDLDGATVNLRHGLNLNVIAVGVLATFAFNVAVDVFSDEMTEIFTIFSL